MGQARERTSLIVLEYDHRTAASTTSTSTTATTTMVINRRLPTRHAPRRECKSKVGSYAEDGRKSKTTATRRTTAASKPAASKTTRLQSLQAQYKMKKGGRSKLEPRRKPLARGAGVQRKRPPPPMISLRKKASSSEDDDSGVVDAEIVRSDDETEDEDVARPRVGDRPGPVSDRTRSSRKHDEEAAAALIHLSSTHDVDDDASFSDDDDEEDEKEDEAAKKAPQKPNQVLNKARRKMLKRRVVSLEKALHTTWKVSPWWPSFDLFLCCFNEYGPNQGGKQRAPSKRKVPQLLFFGRDMQASKRIAKALQLGPRKLQCRIHLSHRPNDFMRNLAEEDEQENESDDEEEEE